MTQLPPFRTRRNEPVMNLDDHEPDDSTLPEDDEDVPVLTQVVDSEPAVSASTDRSGPATAPGPIDSDALDALAVEIATSLQPELERLVREALHRRLG